MSAPEKLAEAMARIDRLHDAVELLKGDRAALVAHNAWLTSRPGAVMEVTVEQTGPRHVTITAERLDAFHELPPGKHLLYPGRLCVTDGAALAFHQALTDSSIGQSEIEEIKTGLRAALAAMEGG